TARPAPARAGPAASAGNGRGRRGAAARRRRPGARSPAEGGAGPSCKFDRIGRACPRAVAGPRRVRRLDGRGSVADRNILDDVIVRWGPLGTLGAEELAQWSALGRGTSWSNPFAMPEFVLPAARWLEGPEPAVVRVLRGNALLGVGCFVDQGPDLFAPLRRLGSFRSLHSYRCGLLVRDGEDDVVARALLQSARSAARLGGSWHERARFERPVLRLDAGPVEARVPAAVRKDLERRLRRLREQGAVEFRLLHGNDAGEAAVERHLRLEHQGWKREAGTSLLACERQAAFFRDMCARFRAVGAMVFGELVLDGQAIASTSNILLGD